MNDEVFLSGGELDGPIDGSEKVLDHNGQSLVYRRLEATPGDSRPLTAVFVGTL